MAALKESGDSEKRDKDPAEEEYLGNIWGWRFSLIGLVLILLMLALMIYRHYTMDIPFGGEETESPEQTEQPVDSPKDHQE